MNLVNDLSVNTLVQSAVIGIVGWLVKKAFEISIRLLVSYIKSLLTQLGETTKALTTLSSDMERVLRTISEFDKMKDDLNKYYARLKVVESKLDR